MSELKPIVEQSFQQYSGAVLQSRALVDVRDALKPSARQIFYALFTDKFTHDKPYKKTLKAVGSLSRFYIHGDSSAVGVLMRAGQPFAMRYPLVDIKGNGGDLIESGDWAHQRYTESRLSQLTSQLFADIDKDTIKEWRDNYDNEEQYPSVLPTKGFYNIVNGTMGIGIGMSSSVPQFNLKEVNEALIKLLWDPSISYEDLYCAPDFATGAILLNEEEVKKCLKFGAGGSCKLRSVVDFDSKERCFVVTEIPYGTYTNTICGQLEEIINGEENPGIDRFNDLTGKTPLIKIYLEKKANPDKVLRYLYKNTSLQSFYSINFTMLKDGRYPRVFGWKEALQEHINHEIEVYTRGYNYDLKKIEARLHIIEGLLIAMASIDEVVHTIKESSSSAAANQALQKNFLLDEAQAKAILDMKLSRLAHLEVSKLEKEKTDLEVEWARLNAILSDENLLKSEIEKGLKAVAEKFGDGRRTKILNIEKEDDEPTEIKSLNISLTNKNNIIISEQSSLYTQRKGTIGTKYKLDKGEYVISSLIAENTETILFFSERGNYYPCDMTKVPYEEKIAIESIVKAQAGEQFCAITSYSKKNAKKNIIFITKNGMLKKSAMTEYSSKRAGGAKAINLDYPTDKIRSILFTDEEQVGILTKEGNFLVCETKPIRAIGRAAAGVRGIKLNDGDTVASARIIPKDTDELVSVTQNGYAKKSSKAEFSAQATNTKGKRIQKLKEDDDKLVDFLPVAHSEKEVVISSSFSQLRIKLEEIPLLNTGTFGNKTIKLSEGSRVVGIEKI